MVTDPAKKRSGGRKGIRKVRIGPFVGEMNPFRCHA